MTTVNVSYPYGVTLDEALVDIYSRAVDGGLEPTVKTNITKEAMTANPVCLISGSRMFNLSFESGNSLEASDVHTFIASMVVAVNAGERVKDPVNTFASIFRTWGLYGVFTFNVDEAPTES